MNPDISPSHNLPEYSVSEIAGAIKQQVEDRFGYVRVRGEISGLKLATSGHSYFRLKDEGAVLDAVMWKSMLGKMKFKPEEGLEVIASGRITTYPGKSSYQIVVEKMEPAGAGALMALLEARKQKLAAEGLFAPERKKALPYLPEVIGVITSPTGAVIRDILHRIADRFPCRVIVWPVLVQGEQAAEQIAAAIEGFNRCEDGGMRRCEDKGSGEPPSSPPHLLTSSHLFRPDLLIVARGGGSLEDLWAFNEEIVVRAAAASAIPLISAVGHETDTTLIDFAADKRAPTPTAAAEMAVPVKAELELSVRESDTRLRRAIAREFSMREERMVSLHRGLPKPEQLLEHAMQRLDVVSDRLHCSLPLLIERRFEMLLQMMARLPKPERLMEQARLKLQSAKQRLSVMLPVVLEKKRSDLALLQARLRPTLLLKDLAKDQERLGKYREQLTQAMMRIVSRREDMLANFSRLLANVSFEATLKRGFALVKSEDGILISDAESAKKYQKMSVQFADGVVKVAVD